MAYLNSSQTITSKAQPVRILYAEDYDLVLQTVQQLLEMEGWEVDVCRDGVTALNKIRSSSHYDVIIVDENLPGIRGLELLQMARSYAHRHQALALMFTAVDCQPQAKAIGADEFLRKPDGIKEINKIIKRYLKRLSLAEAVF
jgi:DNA-binding response OmpR family regulator